MLSGSLMRFEGTLVQELLQDVISPKSEGRRIAMNFSFDNAIDKYTGLRTFVSIIFHFFMTLVVVCENIIAILLFF